MSDDEQSVLRGGVASVRYHRCAAFTIVELLVVISIIALLITLLLPALRSAQDAARAIQCASNQRQIAMAQHVYADDWEGRFTRYYTGNQGETTFWHIRLRGYLENAQRGDPTSVINCPSADALTIVSYRSGQGGWSIGLSSVLRANQWKYRRDAVPQPSAVILLGEGPEWDIDYIFTSNGFRFPTSGWGTVSWAKPFAIRHGGDRVGQAAFVDGHVEALTYEQTTHDAQPNLWIWW